MGIEDDRTILAASLGASRSAPIEPGTRLNETYEVDALVGRGGMSEIYRGRNIQTDETVAIKVLLPESKADEQIVSLFRREALMLNRLGHAAIVRYHVFSYDRAHDLLYMAMEFVDGPSLRDFISDRPLSQREACSLIARVAEGMAVAHREGIVHRDLSTDNIILEDADVARPKVIDFGIARAGQNNDATILRSGFAGKLNFVSPEQVGLFGGKVEPVSDVYSLGLVFAAALRGRALDMGGSQADVVLKRQRSVDLSFINPGVKVVLERMLQPDPARRLGSMEEVREQLASLLGERRAESRKRIEPSDAVVAPKPRRPKRFARVLVLPLLMAAAGAVAWFATTPEDRSRWVSLIEQRLGEGAQKPIAAAPQPGGKETLRADDPVPVKTVTVTPVTGAPTEEPEASGPQAVAPASRPTAPRIDETGPGANPRANPEPSSRPNLEPDPEVAIAVPPADAPPSIVEAPTVAPPVEPPVDEGAEEGTIEPRVWLEALNAQECFLAMPVAGAPDHTIEAYGRDIAAFQDLEQRYIAAFSTEPTIGARMVTAAQCDIVDAVAALRSGGPAGPTLRLKRDVVTQDEPMSLFVSDIAQANVALYVVTPDATVANVTSLAQSRGDGIELEIPYEPFAQQGAAEYLVLALSSDRALPLMKSGRNPVATTFLRNLGRETLEADANVRASLAYLRKR